MKFKYQSLLFLIIFATVSQLCFGQLSTKIAPVVAQFGSQLVTDLRNDNLHGSISVAIIKNDRLIWAGAYGYADKENNIIADSTTIYRIGSITKTFTATLLMQLIEERKIKLDDPVENYLPEIKNLNGYADAGKITFRQLASHTSGLKREPDMHNADVGPLEQWENKVLACIPKTSFNSKPGQEFLYSNIGVAILGLALSRVTGVPYIQMVQEGIFTPLHMDDTFFALPDDKRARLAEGLSNNEKGDKVNTELPLQEIKGRGYRVPNGGIFSTPGDLSKFVLSLMGKPPLLTAESRKEMQNIPDGGKKYGLGLMIINNQHWNVIWHNGSVPGYTSQFLIDQQSGYAVILMRNYNFGSTDLEKAALGLLRGLKDAD
jgi:CubicO group peptidase (beta-lactamase class C family)